MKNNFDKQDNTAIICAVVIGAAIAGGLAYLFLTESGNRLRGNLKATLKEKGKDIAAGALTRKTGVPKDITKAAADTILD